MLILQLKELEKEKLISRTVYNEAPPRVEYELTNIAKQLSPIWRELEKWGAKHREIIDDQESESKTEQKAGE